MATDLRFARTRHFVVIRSDGSSTDFSFKVCVTGASLRRDRVGALRSAIAQQVADFKSRAFAGRTTVPCRVRGVMTSFRDADVDHAPPTTFDRLVEQWLCSEGLKLEDIAIGPAADNQIVSEITDNEQLTSWQAFHLKYARLRITCRAANLSEVRLE